ncbi:hypothetical protein [Nocardia terpenica]|uniref:Uncharacterized protein n=1 Tax=Nocardia terpenica TaxID=455432 RepID=A0A164HV85_9NOCA|nr:hypothetical protein [Nocardia terpenica]KZM68849.1 hypothetical protein AWN90_13755 [Nocardia terpenica]NQE88107.1 hypothetical protein [Nocardia terpenica]
MTAVLPALDVDQINEGRQWIYDHTDHVAYDWKDSDVAGYVAAHYDGGIEAFATSVRGEMARVYGKDWRKRCDHFAEFYARGYRTDYKDLLLVKGTHAQDQYGYDDVVGIANYRVLREQWGDAPGLSDGPYSNCDYIALDLDSEAPEDMTETLDALESYPVLDDQVWSEVEQEQIQEHWDNYGRWDLHKAVREAIGAYELTDAAEAIIDRLVWEGLLEYGYGGGYPIMIDSSACDFGEGVIPGWIAARLGSVVTLSHWGRTEIFDLRKRNIIAE